MTSSARYRWSVASRALAAIVGGYALTSLLTIALSELLPRWGMEQAQVVLLSAVMSFLVFAAIIMAVFHTRTASRAWLWLTAASVTLGIIIVLSRAGNAS